MAQEYEVREEYRGYSLDQLLEASVLCFQGVGDIQGDLIKQYFKIGSIRDLANMPTFLEALEIQELAVNGGDLATQPISQIARGRTLNLKLRERAQDMTPVQLMHESVQVLDGLTPGQDLALYDIFRITNIAHLAQNRIMLEARVIQYLQGQEAEGAEGQGEEGVASVLGRPGTRSAQATRRVTADRETGGLEAAAQETSEHVQTRLEVVRDRAKTRAASIARGEDVPSTPAGQRGGIGTRVASAAAPGTSSRMEAIRATRTRTEAGGRTSQVASARGTGSEPGAPVGRGVSDRTMRSATGRPTGRVVEQVTRRGTAATSVSRERGTLGAPAARGTARTLGGGAAAGRGATRTYGAGAAAGAGRTIDTGNRASAVMAARGAAPAAGPSGLQRHTSGGGGGSSAAPRTSGGGGTRTYSGGGSSATARVPAASAPAAAVAAVAPAAAQPAARPTRRGTPPGVLLLIAALVVVAIGVAWWFMRGTGSTPMAPGGTTAVAPAGTTTGAPGGTSGGMVAPAGSSSTMTGPQPTGTGSVRTGSAPGAAAGKTQAAGTARQVPTVAPGTTYQVSAGNSLWRISRRFYAYGSKWPAIYQENQDQISDPDLIFPQQQFRIPSKPQR